MILRKPYAFLVKHFRLIHVVLLLLMAYVAYSLYNVFDFYNGYIAMSLTTNDYAYNTVTVLSKAAQENPHLRILIE